MVGLFDSIPAAAPAVSTRGTDFWLHEGTIFGRTRPGTTHGELEDAIDVVAKIKLLTGNSRHPLLFDARNVGWVQIEAREHAHRHAAELFTCAGVVVRPRTAKVLSRALLGGADIEIPVALFVDERDAWDFVRRSAAA